MHDRLPRHDSIEETAAEPRTNLVRLAAALLFLGGFVLAASVVEDSSLGVGAGVVLLAAGGALKQRYGGCSCC